MRRNRQLRGVVTLAALATLSACGGGGSNDSGPADGVQDGGGSDAGGGVTGSGATAGGGTDGGANGGPGGGTGTGGDGPLVPGDVARYGIVTVSDDAGEPGDALAAFFDLSASVAPAGFRGALEPDAAECRVRPKDDRGFEEVLMGFLPRPDGVSLASVDVGGPLVLSSGAGTFAELESTMTGEFLFYDAGTTQMQAMAGIPADLVVDVPGGVFPAFSAALPTVEPLTGFAVESGADAAVGGDSRFTWDAGTAPGTKVRIVSSEGFFSDDGGVKVSCIVPDTGGFEFSEETRAQLGADFAGETPTASRVAIDTESADDALLILVRETFPAP